MSNSQGPLSYSIRWTMDILTTANARRETNRQYARKWRRKRHAGLPKSTPERAVFVPGRAQLEKKVRTQLKYANEIESESVGHSCNKETWKRRNQSENSSNWNCMFCSALSLLFANDTRSPCTVWESYDTERGGRARGPLIERRRIPLSSFSFLNFVHIKRSARNRYIQLQERERSRWVPNVSLSVPWSSFRRPPFWCLTLHAGK